MKANELGYRAFCTALLIVAAGLTAATAWLAAKGAAQIILWLLGLAW
jgi:hypothetical protein